MTESQNLNSNPEETPVLRCNRCDQPITPETAVLTPTGYRCQNCVKQQQKVFDNTRFFDIILGFIIAAVLSYAGGWLVSRLGFFTLLVAPSVGVLIYRAVRLVVNKRRSRALNNAILLGAIIGCIPMLVPEITALIFSGGDAFSFTGSLLPLIWRVVYTVLVASTAYAQSKGLRL